MKSVGILGVSGMMAQALLRALERDPDIGRIVGIDARPPRFHPARLEFHPADLRQAPIGKLLRGVDAIVHLALSPARDGEGGAGTPESIRRVWRAAQEAGAGKLVAVTSIAAYGAHLNNPVPIQEWHALRPNDGSALARGWASIEDALDAIERETPEIVLVRLRAAPVIGPSLEGDLKRLVTLDRIVLARALDVKLQLLHEEDLARACVLALTAGATGTYNLAAAGPAQLSALYEAAGARVSFLPVPALRAMTWIAARLRASLVPMEALTLAESSILVNTGRIRRELGWEARYSTLETFLKTRRALKGEGDE